jgi:hypothetical protein
MRCLPIHRNSIAAVAAVAKQLDEKVCFSSEKSSCNRSAGRRVSGRNTLARPFRARVHYFHLRFDCALLSIFISLVKSCRSGP